MSEIMRPIPFDKIITWMLEEYKNHGKVFGIHKDSFYKNNSGTSIELFGEKISSAIGPAAGPNSQLVQNIVASYLAGARMMELKTVQIMDGKKLRECVPRPCINAEDECYNVEWSTELTVQEAFDEYTKAHFAIMIAAREFGLVNDKNGDKDFSFNMSVGYDLEGIQTKKIDDFIEGLKDASSTDIFKTCKSYLLENISTFKHIDKAYIESIPENICSSITLSTLHGCPPDEINRIATYLLKVKKVHTYIKCNPTLLGYDFTRNILDDMGYHYLVFDDHHFNNDLQYDDAIDMFKNLMDLSKNLNLEFGLKLTNTFPVKIDNNELPGEEMYMSGRSLYPLSISLANKLSKAFNGTLPISYSGGADAFNIGDILETGIKPVTMATTILKPGGVERFHQMAVMTEHLLDGLTDTIDVEKLDRLATSVTQNFKHQKKLRPTGSRKTDSILPLYDCFKAPCKDGGCPIEQQIPEYLKLVSEKKYDEAFKVIAIDNATPAITGAICNHACQTKCTRLDYDTSLNIRNSKKIAVLNAQDKYIENLRAPEIQTDKRAVVIGAGPGGVSAALFLRRNGMDVTILEKRDRPFGIIEYVIPEFRIPQNMIDKDYKMALKMGVNFKFNADPDVNIDALKKEFDFIIMATGAWKKGYIPVKEGGEKLMDALDFLLESKKENLKVDLGKRVAIIGAGDVAMDCARAARKAPGVETSTIVYRRTRDNMPAEFDEIELTLNDDVDLIELLSPISYDGNNLECEVMALKERDASDSSGSSGSSGRRGVVSTGKPKTLQFDTVIAAVGARVDTSVYEKNKIEINTDGSVKVNASNETNIDNVYVAGDSKAGAATIVSAGGDAKKIAMDILSKCNLDHDFVRVFHPFDVDGLIAKKGMLVEPNYEPEDGQRCLACDQVCEVCVDVCPNRANVVIGENKIAHIDVMCNECGNCGVFCPHTGNPYKDKITIFWTDEDFHDSENKGFLPLGDNTFKLRDEKGNVFESSFDETSLNKIGISNEMRTYMGIIIRDFPFYLPVKEG